VDLSKAIVSAATLAALAAPAAAQEADDVPLPAAPYGGGAFAPTPGPASIRGGAASPDPVFGRGGFGPAAPGSLSLDAPAFGATTAPPGGDPAFGPMPARPPGPLVPVPVAVPFTPDIPPHRPMPVRAYAWTYIDAPPPRTILLHDIITILVDEKSELLISSRYNRQRNATFQAQLKEFLRIDDNFDLATAAPSSPQINAQLRSRLQSSGDTTDREGIRYRIAATVVGVLPNGNVVLEARKQIRSSDGLWEYTLTGTIASRDIKSDYTAVSETIANLQIEKRQKGKVADSTQRPWGMWLYDKLSPF
jgi:flagellar L-ring protein precursor FlgH